MGFDRDAYIKAGLSAKDKKALKTEKDLYLGRDAAYRMWERMLERMKDKTQFSADDRQEIHYTMDHCNQREFTVMEYQNEKHQEQEILFLSRSQNKHC